MIPNSPPGARAAADAVPSAAAVPWFTDDDVHELSSAILEHLFWLDDRLARRLGDPELSHARGLGQAVRAGLLLIHQQAIARPLGEGSSISIRSRARLNQLTRIADITRGLLQHLNTLGGDGGLRQPSSHKE